MTTGLLLRLGADTSAFSKGMSDASKSTRTLTGREKALLGVTTALAAAFAVNIKRTIDYGDWLDKTSQKMGVSTEALSGYKLAAELAGSSQQGLVKGLQKLQKNMGAALQTPTSAAGLAFRRLGLDITDADGHLRNVEDMLPEFADAISNLDDGTTKTSIAMELMGRSGAELIPFLNAGADGLASMAEEAEAMGVVMSEDVTKASAEFNDAITRLKTTADGFFQQSASFYIPALADIAEGSVIAMRAIMGLDEAQQRADDTRDRSRAAIVRQAEETERARDKLQMLTALLEKHRAKQDTSTERIALYEDAIAKANEELDRQMGLSRRVREEMGGDAGLITERTRALRDEARARAEAAMADPNQGTGPAPKVGPDPEAEAMKQREAALRSYEQALGAMGATEQRVTLAQLSGGERVLAQLEVERQALERRRDEVLANERLTEAERLAIRTATAEAIEALEHESHREIFAIRSKAVADQERMDAQRLRSADRSSGQEVGHAQTTAGALIGLGQTITQAAIAGHAQQGAESKKAAREQFAVQQAFAFAVAGVQMAVAIAQASASAPTPANIPAIAAATAIGIATMATIAATTISGIADGGLMPDTLRKAGLNRHSVLAVRNDEMVLPPQATRDMVETMALAKRASFSQVQQGGGGGVRYVNDRPIVLDGREVGRIVDDHLIRSEERGMEYGQRVRTRMTA